MSVEGSHKDNKTNVCVCLGEEGESLNTNVRYRFLRMNRCRSLPIHNCLMKKHIYINMKIMSLSVEK